MTCRDFIPLLVRNALPLPEQVRLDAHLASCEACREAAELLRIDAPPEPALVDGVELGSTVENYRIDKLIGTGGMSLVYAATHAVTGHRVAIKLMRRELVASAELVERFTREASLVARLRGEQICRITTFGQLASGAPYMVLELLHGEDLHAVLERGPLTVPTVVDHVLQACAGLAEAHAQGIVHRDLKPANLFVIARPDGSPLLKILDFGIAKLRFTSPDHLLTRTGARLGSLPYMAPEQLRSSRTVDTRADIWSLGVTLQQLATGELPFSTRHSPADTAIRIWTDEPAPPHGVPPGLADVVHACLAKDPRDRPGDVARLAAALAPFGGPRAIESSARVARILEASAR